MSEPSRTSAVERVPLSRERILSGAMGLAGASGIGSLTIRSLAQELGVRPMSIYHYVATKDELLDGMVDRVFEQIDLPSASGAWREELHGWAHSARRVLTRNSWAIALLESRATPGPATLRHHDRIIGVLRGAGLPAPMTAHAYALLDSYVYGFAIQESALPFTRPGASTTPPVTGSFAADYPHLAELAAAHVVRPGHDFGDEFEVGLAIVLDGLAGLIPPS